MEIRFYLDPESGIPHIWGHGVDEDEVRDVLQGPIEDRDGYDGARVAIGRTRNGRDLRVVYVIDTEPLSIFVITAYPLVGKALKAFKRRQRKRR
ncbi:MAG: DUF4258 domain-containing protein [Planctomycetota bacterium]